jgi:hypothetical protein
MKLVVAALGAVVLAASAALAAAPAPDPSQFTVGTSTISDVEAVYGQPTTQSVVSTGDRVLIYATSHAHVKAVTFVPVVGLFAGGAKASAQSMSFVFDKDGKLKAYSGQTTNVDCSSAIISATCGH